MDAHVDKPPPPPPPVPQSPICPPPGEPRAEHEPLPPGGVCGDPLRTLSCLLETVEELNSASDLTSGLERVAQRLQHSIDFDTFAVLLLDDRGQELRFHFALGLPEDVVEHWRFGLGQGLVGLAASTGEPLTVGDVRTDPRYIRARDEVRSEAALPLVSKSRVVGVLDVGSFQVDFFSAEHLRFLKLIAGHLAHAIDNSRLYANLRQQARTLSLLHEASRELTAILNRQEL
ncbi:MAG: GAF domain-containing protein, partial [bacterium]|nr:GAF domain-containing protein [bacterium]